MYSDQAMRAARFRELHRPGEPERLGRGLRTVPEAAGVHAIVTTSSDLADGVRVVLEAFFRAADSD